MSGLLPPPGWTLPLFAPPSRTRPLTWRAITVTGHSGPPAVTFGVALTQARLLAERDGQAWLLDTDGAACHLTYTTGGWQVSGETTWAAVARNALTASSPTTRDTPTEDPTS